MSPMEVLRDMRDEVRLLMAETGGPPVVDFVQEVVLAMPGGGSSTSPGPGPPVSPIFKLDADEWTIINGSIATVDSRFRTAVAVGDAVGTTTRITQPITIATGSDFTIRAWLNGEVNDLGFSPDLVAESIGGTDGIHMAFTASSVGHLGLIKSQTLSAPQSKAFDPNIYEYRVVHASGTTSIFIDGVLVASGVGSGALGVGVIVVELPYHVAVYGLHILDYAWSTF